MRLSSRRSRCLVATLLSVGLLAACGGDDEPGDAGAASTETTAPSKTTVAEAEPLRVVLSNDDGIVNPAIDVMLGVLEEEEGLEITVVAPAGEKSGSSDKTTDGGATYQEARTPGGVKGYAVDGFPADSVASPSTSCT